MLPLAWGTTLLCAFLAYLLRLNQAGIQAANYLAFPLQITLLVPFYRMGARMFPGGATASAKGQVQQLGSDWVKQAALILVATLKALVAWLLVAGPAAALLYFFLLSITARMLRNRTATSQEGIVFDGDMVISGASGRLQQLQRTGQRDNC
jgi:hypothetical protein